MLRKQGLQNSMLTRLRRMNLSRLRSTKASYPCSMVAGQIHLQHGGEIGATTTQIGISWGVVYLVLDIQSEIRIITQQF